MLTLHIEGVVVQLLLGRVIGFGLKYLLVENISVFLPEAVALQNAAGAQWLMKGKRPSRQEAQAAHWWTGFVSAKVKGSGSREDVG